MIAHIATCALVGIEGLLVDVETDLKQGLPGIHIVGMGNKAVDEARERVRSAITHSLLDFPPRKLTINLAPAELRKDGAHFDLPIALSILVANEKLQQTEVDGALFAGELGLDGSLRPIRGAVTIAELALSKGLKTVYVPLVNAPQAALVRGIQVIGVSCLKDLFLHLKGVVRLRATPPTTIRPSQAEAPSLDDIKGNEKAKRALVIAAAGRHNILLCGPPGAGKTMLARTLIGLLPPPLHDEQLAITKLHSLAGQAVGTMQQRPFRAPHHSSSTASLIGGGAYPRPGEISLAHHGVLFLDELPEFNRSTLEALRQPLEDKHITLTRAGHHLTYPADCLLVATMNPCPCGFLGDEQRMCSCSTSQVAAYQKHLSGPLLDRIDIILTVSKVDPNTFFSDQALLINQQHTVLGTIKLAVKQQSQRYHSGYVYNATLSPKQLSTLEISTDARQLLNTASTKLGLTGRGYIKVIKVARTIADLEENTTIETAHIAEALQYRLPLQR